MGKTNHLSICCSTSVRFYDPIGSSEGSLDPLGLYLIADQLAMKLVPGVRERMLRVRFLTAMAVGALVTEGLQPNRPHRPPGLQNRRQAPHSGLFALPRRNGRRAPVPGYDRKGKVVSRCHGPGGGGQVDTRIG